MGIIVKTQTQYTLICDFCKTTAGDDSRKKFVKQWAKDNGWRFVLKGIWICKYCLEQVKSGKGLHNV